VTTADIPVTPSQPMNGWLTQQGSGRGRALLRGRTADPGWVRPCLLLLLLGTAVAYLWSLSANGWGNDFYAAAIQAGSKSWKAFLFGSSDAGNTITVDKPPGSLWLPALSVRIFGLSSWSVLVPQALMGVGTVGVVYASVRRFFTPGAGLLAGLVVALSPVAALMFRFDNPDALLVLLMTSAAYFGLRAMAEDRLRWYVATGVAVGFGFLTKQLQVFLIAPGLLFAFLLAGQGSLWRRLRGMAIAVVAIVVAAGWWVALVQLWPKNSRPYIGGSKNNSFLELTFGYNGLGRLTGDESTGLGGGGGGSGGANPLGRSGGIGSIFGGSTGITRMFDGVVGGQIAWLIPAALIALVAGVVLRGRLPRTDMQRASLVMWGGWLLATALVFSYMSGIFHEYYTVALTPAVGALVGIGGAKLWEHREHWAALLTGAVAVGLTGWWAYRLLHRAPKWNSWLATSVLIVGAVAVAVFIVLAVASLTHKHLPAAVPGVAAGLAVAVSLAGPAAWTMQTISGSRSGAIITAGPTVAGGRGGFPGGGGGAGFAGGAGGRAPDLSQAELRELLAELPANVRDQLGGDLPTAGGAPQAGGQFPEGFQPPAGGGDFPQGAGSRTGQPPTEVPAGGTAEVPTGGTAEVPTGGTAEVRPGATAELPTAGAFAGGGMGGLGAGKPSSKVLALLKKNASSYTWIAATTSATAAAPYQLATQLPVMPIGGFSGSDPAPTLAAFKNDVTKHRIHYYISGGGGGFGGMLGGSRTETIASWVSAHFKSSTVDGVTLYDLSNGPTK
jgi:4-amino-4-deoxy-L-arabinose transferase-like glycosyltransferase